MNANDGSVACVVCARRTKRQASFHQRGCLKNLRYRSSAATFDFETMEDGSAPRQALVLLSRTHSI